VTAVAVVIACAAALWFLMFSPWVSSGISFWVQMTVAVALLVAAVVAIERRRWVARLRFRAIHVLAGLAAAAFLYLAFAIAHAVGTRLFDFAASEVAAIYGRRAQADPIAIGIALFVWIGPGEELVWRGFVQHRLAERFGAWRGYLFAALLYAGVHVWSFNLMLVLAALLCGLLWGALYSHFRSLWPGLISHAVWDLAIFVLLPLG
jgi:membrane protease YdiL (CAAX protease family)